jgi:hypothetical protein
VIRVHVADLYLFAADRIAVRFASGDPDVQPRRIASVLADPHQGAVLDYQELPDVQLAATPTLSLTEAEGRALLDALAAFYGGTGPAKAARDDLLHERGRVDKLTDALIGIAADARSRNA